MEKNINAFAIPFKVGIYLFIRFLWVRRCSYVYVDGLDREESEASTRVKWRMQCGIYIYIWQIFI